MIAPKIFKFALALAPTILLAIVVFCVPYLKRVYFLKAAINYQGVSGSITFGTLGYCIELSGNTTCSPTSIGYQLDINGLVGNSLPIQIPQIAVKWLTYVLFLHVIGLVLAALSAITSFAFFCDSLFSNFAFSVTTLAAIFDVALFLTARARINAIGSAQTGSALWFTMIAALCLFARSFLWAI